MLLGFLLILFFLIRMAVIGRRLLRNQFRHGTDRQTETDRYPKYNCDNELSRTKHKRILYSSPRVCKKEQRRIHFDA